jgi:hypothetical protein
LRVSSRSSETRNASAASGRLADFLPP